MIFVARRMEKNQSKARNQKFQNNKKKKVKIHLMEEKRVEGTRKKKCL